MKLPPLELTRHDPFLSQMRRNDEKKFLSVKKGANQRFHQHRRILTSYDLLKNHLGNSSFKVADIACGTADLGLLMAEAGYDVDLIDNEPHFFDYIKMKKTSGKTHFIHASVLEIKNINYYDAIFLGEALEHMADPLLTLIHLKNLLKVGGYLCLTTPNGSYVDCYEKNWSEVKNQKERNQKLANTIGNHVCEFTPAELKDLIKEAGMTILEHSLVISKQVSSKPLLRFILPENILWKLDHYWSKKKHNVSQSYGMTQIVLAQRGSF